MKLQFIHYPRNEDLSQSVRNLIPDDGGQTLFRDTLNQHLYQGAGDMHAHIKAYRALKEAGYEAGEDGKWLRKTVPTVGDAHVDAPLGGEPKDEEKDDPGTVEADIDDLTAVEQAERKFIPPEEVRKTAQEARAGGFVIQDLTEELIGGAGVTIERVQEIAAHFAKDEREPDIERKAWGGKHAAKWAKRLLEKLEEIEKFNPNQPRDDHGRFGEAGGGGDQVGGRAASKSEIARANYNPATREKQQRGDDTERRLARSLGLQRTKDNSPFDLTKGNTAVEVKTLIDAKTAKITMRKECRERKLNYAKANNMIMHTVVADARAGQSKYYYAQGVGSFRLSAMKSMSLSQLKDAIG